MSSFREQIHSAAQFVQEQWNKTPIAGIVLGTGSGQIAESLEVDVGIDYGDIPNFPQSTALGHKGRLVCGRFAGRPVVAMQGRFHVYEGYSYQQVTLPIHVLASLGISRLLISNAAGGVNPKFLSGEIMLIESQVDFMLRTSSTLFNVNHLRGNARPDSANDQSLLLIAEKVARQNDFVVHRGVYAGLLGPNYETRAEYRMLRRIGADAAGMSTLPEIAVAARYELPVLACSIITNVAKPDVLEPTSGQEVIDAAEVAAPNLKRIFEAAVQ